MPVKVTSREYKVMLNTERFEDREAGCAAIWELVTFLAKRQEILTGGVSVDTTLKDGKPDDELREVCYHDTPAQALRQSGFILRVRAETSKSGKKKYQTTLKYRDADRHVTASKNVEPSIQIDQKDRKFEEDVVPPFQIKYSKSASIKAEEEPNFRSQQEVAGLFPGLENLEISAKTAVGKVKDFTAHEFARKAGSIEFEAGVTVKCALSFWYLSKERAGRPVAAEFSFDFEDDDENFPIKTVSGANALFASLQKQSGWVDRSSTTKTAYAYDAL
jgi:hypothetical protein